MTMPIDIERFIHSLKTAIACIIAFFLTKIVGLAADQWIVITVIVVMCAQIYVGSVIQKAYLRFLGTLIGCLLASVAILSLGDTDLAIIASIAFSSFLFSYLATGQESLSYMGTLGAVTTAIIMLGPKPTIAFAGQRFLEISVGILIAALISQFILPIRARTHLRRAQAETLKLLRDFYTATMINYSINTSAEYQDLDESIVKTILKQRQLAKESVPEKLGEKFNKGLFMVTLYCEREILRTISFMHHAFTHIENANTLLAHLPALENFNIAIQKALDTFVKVIEKGEASKDHIHLFNLDELKDAVYAQCDLSSQKQTMYIDGFLFSAEILTDTLIKLAALYGISAYRTQK